MTKGPYGSGFDPGQLGHFPAKLRTTEFDGSSPKEEHW